MSFLILYQVTLVYPHTRDENFHQVISQIKAAAEAGKQQEACETASLACALWPDEAEAWLWRAFLCADADEALAHAQQAARLQPSAETAQALRWTEARARRTTEDEGRRTEDDERRKTTDVGRKAVIAQKMVAGVGTVFEGLETVGRRVAQAQPPRNAVLFVATLGLLLVLLLVLLLSGGPSRPLTASQNGVVPVQVAAAHATSAIAYPSPIRESVEPQLSAPRQPGHAQYVRNRPKLPFFTRLQQMSQKPALLVALFVPAPIIPSPKAGQPLAQQHYSPPIAAPMSAAAVDAMLYPSTETPSLVATDDVSGTLASVIDPITSTAPIDLSKYALWPARTEAVPYLVQPGDNPTSIATMFGLRLSTIIWANGTLETNPELLSVGQELLIPPLDGVLHTVKEGDTLTSIATLYSADPNLIAWFPGNNLNSVDAPLTVGNLIMVPSGRKPYVAPPAAPTAPVRAAQPSSSASSGSSTRGYFAWPTGGRITQASSAYHTALDIAAPMNTPIYAAAGGTILVSGWDTTGYGYTIVIDHGGGWRTRYAHLSGMYYEAGARVSQGELIALMGSTGHSTGPHLHFEITYNGWRYNPIEYLPR